ncbi:AKT-interacting protein isoform X1 [Numida meleagris]|uniref:AKT-interacting protein isoform X1 n=2 Tax=Numida meleagris TaxID=8996 RepID=UPI000B3D849F|nr:AKT-interacting protein isoform X1 [Numida meleagris]XP_021264612.1 AKT-interacting protein isoform X1 [Numida meleagris]XP_021264613.1 AKT-interacting protein isoform X1 [Numida meleagris]XP_021264614.1 AKT-interacting protein isoform X1 [Numida meleagris]XP_021264615.1 AKT-interacting protein isoform X1 [Numida meleagris]
MCESEGRALNGAVAGGEERRRRWRLAGPGPRVQRVGESAGINQRGVKKQKTLKNCRLLFGTLVMNPFWSMSTASGRKRPEADEKTLTGELRTSPPRASAKKQLPCVPKNAVPVTKPASPAMSSQSTNGTHASYGPFYLEYSLLAEFTLVVKQKLPGVYVQPSYRSALMWFGVIFIRHGLYQDGVFKFTVYIPDNYPDGDCPRLVFDLPVFHPLVDPLSGELDVKRAFAKWRRNHNHIWQVLMYARRVFYKIDTTSPLNPEAAVLYEKDIQLFKSKVVDSVKLCSSHLFDQPKIEDPYAIVFSPWNPAIHDEAREKMLTQKKKPEDQHCKSMHGSGLSWVKPGSVQPFSKEEKTMPT